MWGVAPSDWSAWTYGLWGTQETFTREKPPRNSWILQTKVGRREQEFPKGLKLLAWNWRGSLHGAQWARGQKQRSQQRLCLSDVTVIGSRASWRLELSSEDYGLSIPGSVVGCGERQPCFLPYSKSPELPPPFLPPFLPLLPHHTQL